MQPIAEVTMIYGGGFEVILIGAGIAYLYWRIIRKEKTPPIFLVGTVFLAQLWGLHFATASYFKEHGVYQDFGGLVFLLQLAIVLFLTLVVLGISVFLAERKRQFELLIMPATNKATSYLIGRYAFIFLFIAIVIYVAWFSLVFFANFF